MAETVIFAEQTLEFSDDFSGLYIAQNKEPFVLESGKTYRVIWDGREFTLNSFNFKMEGFDGIGIGNEAFFTGVSTELTEPFSVYYLTSSGYSAIVTTDNSASHTVAIYLVEESLSVVVKDRTGADVEYSGVAGIRVRTTDGDTKDFLDSSAFPSPVETTIQLDFSDGNMIVVPGVDELFSKVTVVKPATLIPGNIAEGIEIGGVLGSLVAGVSPKVARGTFTGSASDMTIEHGLGVVPDLIIVLPTASQINAPVASVIYGLIGFNSELANNLGLSRRRYKFYTNNVKAFRFESDTNYITFNNPTYNSIYSHIYGANATSFIVPPGTGTDIEMQWLAIGGLTE